MTSHHRASVICHPILRVLKGVYSVPLVSTSAETVNVTDQSPPNGVKGLKMVLRDPLSTFIDLRHVTMTGARPKVL